MSEIDQINVTTTSSLSLSSKTLTIGLIMIFLTCTSSIFTKLNFHYIHESSLCMIMGIIISSIQFLLSNSNLDSDISKTRIKEQSSITFDEEIFFNLILPPIIFAAGYNLRKRAFFKYFSYSFFFGVIGTFLNFLLLSGLIYVISYLNIISLPHNTSKPFINLSIYEILSFSAIISATDSVAPLSFIKENEKPKLFAILFGEGVLNDSVCIVLYRIIKDMMNDIMSGKKNDLYDGYGNIINEKSDISQTKSSQAQFDLINISTTMTILYKFLYLFSISLLIGAIGGLICAYSLKKLKKYSPSRSQEVTLILLFPFIIYSFTEYINMSPIISLLFCGVFMSQYAFLNLSFQSREESCIVAKILSNFAESIVFCYLGLSFMSINIEYISYLFIFFLILFIVISRSATVYILSYIINALNSLKIMKKMGLFGFMIMPFERKSMIICGFIRGAISYGLVLTFNTNNIYVKNTLITTTFVIVFVTTIVIGVLLPFIMNNDEKEKNGNGLVGNEQEEKVSVGMNTSKEYTFSFERFEKSEKSDKSHGRHSENDKNEECKLNNHIKIEGNQGYIRSLWTKIDNKYIKPVFIDDWPNVKNEHILISNEIVNIMNDLNMKKRRDNQMSGRLNDVECENDICDNDKKRRMIETD